MRNIPQAAITQAPLLAFNVVRIRHAAPILFYANSGREWYVLPGWFAFEGNQIMALRSKILTKEMEPEESAQELFSERRKPDVGQFRLQVDRQTKASFATYKEAEAAGMVIKKGHPVVRVSVYDTVEGINRILELPKG